MCCQFFSITLQCNLQDFSVVQVWLDLKSSLGHVESKLKHTKNENFETYPRNCI